MGSLQMQVARQRVLSWPSEWTPAGTSAAVMRHCTTFALVTTYLPIDAARLATRECDVLEHVHGPYCVSRHHALRKHGLPRQPRAAFAARQGLRTSLSQRARRAHAAARAAVLRRRDGRAVGQRPSVERVLERGGCQRHKQHALTGTC
jgi:hypothetical protein